MKKTILQTAMIPALFLVVPAIAFAAPETFRELVNMIVQIINFVTPVLITLAIAIFMYNIVGSLGVIGEEGEFSKKKFKDAALWGLLIIFVLVSMWGILRLFSNLFLNT